jgi:hypothetical protein
VAWSIVYYRTASGGVPAEDFLDGCPAKIDARINAVLQAVAAAPPPSFSGGGMWEAMHGEMTGYHEVRVTGPGREQFRLFCLLDRAGPGLPGPCIVALTGRHKPWRTAFTDADYAAVRALGTEYKASSPRRVAAPT